MRVKRISIDIIDIYLLLAFAALLLFGKELQQMHLDQSIYWISSDGPQYINNLNELRGLSFLTHPSLFLTAMPIFLLRIFKENFLGIFILNLAVLYFSLFMVGNIFIKPLARNLFYFFALLFPYSLISPFSINKEVFMIASCLMFIAYWGRGSLTALFFALVFAFLARFYMVIGIFFLLFSFPRNKPPRFWILMATLALCSFAPTMRAYIPGYSPGDADYYQDAGRISSFFFYCSEVGMYWATYFPKYFALMVSKFWSLLISENIALRKFDLVEYFVSFFSIGVFGLASLRLLKAKVSLSFASLVLMGLVAPIPLMWTEIFHWRYFSYVYFFFLFALCRELDSSQHSSQEKVCAE